MINNRDIASELMSEVSTIADGLGLSGTNILAVDSKIDNGDDCFAITTPSRNITMRKATCGGPGTHGLSIGSLGKNQAQVNTVRDITFGELRTIHIKGSFQLTRSDRPSGVCRGYHDDRRLVRG
jgi:hypothetical protein